MKEGQVFTVEPFLSLGATLPRMVTMDNWTLFGEPRALDSAVRAHIGGHAQRPDGADLPD
jgi:methionine aminopeptidase